MSRRSILPLAFVLVALSALLPSWAGAWTANRGLTFVDGTAQSRLQVVTPGECGMACDDATDDRAAFAACVTTGGLACGKILDMTGCGARLTGPGNGNTVASLCDHTSIVGDGGSATFFDFAASFCSGTTTTGTAGCATSADCRGTAPTCPNSASTFAPAGTAVTFLGAVAGASDLTFRGVNIKVNQSPQWGLCTTDSKACRSYCDSGTVGGVDITGMECDADSDCIGGTSCGGGTSGCCLNLSMCTGTNQCVTEGVWPAGKGTIKLFDWGAVNQTVLDSFDVFDLAASTTAVNLGLNAKVQDVNLAAPSGPIPLGLIALGNDFQGATAYSITTGLQGGVGSKVDNIDTRGATGVKLGSTSTNPSSIRNSYVTDKGASSVGIEIGTNGTVEHDAVYETGASAIGVKLTGNNGTIRATTVNVGGGGVASTGVYVGGSTCSMTDTNIAISGAATGIRLLGAGDIITDSSVAGASGTWGPAVSVGQQQATIVGNYFSGTGWCVRMDETAPSPNGIYNEINWSFVGNRCMAPNVSCGSITTGADFSNNYCAWLTPMAVPLWIGDSGWHTTNLCTANGAPWSCCTGAEKGSCDGTSQNTTVVTTGANGLQATAYGQTPGHAKIVGNIFHVTAADNGSLVKFADVAWRCNNSSNNFSACTGAAQGSNWGQGCRCTVQSDCAGTSPTCNASSGSTSTQAIVFDSNLCFTSRADVACVDLLLDDDDFGRTTTNATRATSQNTVVKNSIFAGNAFVTGSARAFRFSSDAPTAANITALSLLSNLFSVGSTRIDGWKWTMGVKDDVPVVQLFSGTVQANTAGQTRTFPPFGGIPAPTTSASGDVAVPIGMNCFRLYCASDALPGASKTNAFTLVKNGTGSSLTCTTAANAATCSDAANTHEVSLAAGDVVGISDALTSGGTATAVSCSLWCELTGGAWY